MKRIHAPIDPAHLLRLMSAQEVTEEFISILRLAIQENLVNQPGPQSGKTALHNAVATHNIVAVDLLRRAGADSTINDKAGKTPLDYAAKKGSAELTEALTKEIKLCPNDQLCMMPCPPAPQTLKF